ncbi:MAG: GNAT family N-acetyltransferase, partial [Microcoleaceae cyanobacterium]
MIRLTLPNDTLALLALAEAVGLFQPNELSVLDEMLVDYFNGNDDSEQFWLTDDDDGPVGVAYCAPEPMADRVWNLFLIAIHPERQGQGRGRALLQYIEQLLVVKGGRLLLVETSSLESFERTREFYRKCGYEEEARTGLFHSKKSL